ncbi:alpha/beta hydrolase [Halapricum hydrolyticum]|uniref:Alpha/beta hydrolase-fold protein n=1 Tax=Halapricum hydrolyticum TaxID=2979991 RepID=A0AAE3IAV6_9EURY|nr:alpha/beta hydrolase-fold protein [Halapricum hydrolyticum]MCU4716657.1 alpha/beta hydrolase-fold protein [Halapricum hydrolyticum]MCU4725738.1 alpha/beta hydrolase-fold protein [Halapricum hydrolyticum]
MDISWQPYDGDPDGTVVGDVRVSDPIVADYLDIERELLAYLPPSYEDGDEHYPVVYMHDGQNLFDEATSYDGEWQVDETMERLAEEELEAIVVGIPNAGEKRPIEYAPFYDPAAAPDDVDIPDDAEPMGDAYADWLLKTVRPAVESTFRVSDVRGVFGSSMGGLISLYSFFRDPEAFAFVGAMSPAVGGPWHEMIECIEDAEYVDGRVYVDVGGDEFSDDPDLSDAFESGAERLVETLESVGYDEQLRYVYDDDAIHHESEWARRFPDAIRFLLP